MLCIPEWGSNLRKPMMYTVLYWLIGLTVYTQALLWLFDYLAGL